MLQQLFEIFARFTDSVKTICKNTVCVSLNIPNSEYVSFQTIIIPNNNHLHKLPKGEKICFIGSHICECENNYLKQFFMCMYWWLIFNSDDANMEYFGSSTRSVGNSLLFPKNEVAPCECKPFRSCPWVRVLDKESMNGLKRLWDCRQIWPLSMLWTTSLNLGLYRTSLSGPEVR